MLNASLFEAAEVNSLTNGPLRLTRDEALMGTPAQKSEFVKHVPVHVEGFSDAREFVDVLIARAKRTHKPGGVWILGDGGVGKSFILDDIQHRYPSHETETTRCTPVLRLDFEGTPVWSTLLIRLILQLGQDPNLLHYQKNDDLRDYLVDALPESGTRAILIDEAQHLWMNTKSLRNRDRMGGALGDALKRLYDSIQVAFVFTGTPGLLKIYEEDLQAKTRWPGLLQLHGFQLDAKFVGLLKALDQAIPLQERSELDKEEVATKIYQATQGNFRLLKGLLAEAVLIAAQQNSPVILKKHFEKAYFNIFLNADKNPFE